MATHTDPVCGMTVDTADAHAESNVGGNTYYFCSENCKQRFEANPTSYGTEPARTSQGSMTSPKFGSAGSGGAELDPGPEKARDDRLHEA